MFTMGYRVRIIKKSERSIWDHRGSELILIERSHSQVGTSWSVREVKPKADLSKRNYEDNLGSWAWADEWMMQLIDRKVATNIRFHDFCEEISEYRCGDCGYWNGVLGEYTTDYDEHLCPKCKNK